MRLLSDEVERLALCHVRHFETRGDSVLRRPGGQGASLH